MRGEFDLIARYFAPLSENALGAESLKNDAALFRPGHEAGLVVTADMMVAGVHFPPEDPPELIGRKLLRVNLSDLAAMGAEPRGYLLTVALPAAIEEAWVEAFAAGLAEDQREFGVALHGGDTVATPGPLTLSLTAFGDAFQGQVLARSRARAGDIVYVSGTIGDGALGLKALRGELPSLSEKAQAALAARYRLPEPRLALGRALIAGGLATAAIDVSDGLAADLGHIAETSGLAAEIEAQNVPLSEAARAAFDADLGLRLAILSGGDDYELLFTAAPDSTDDLAGLARSLDLSITRIGSMTEGRDITVFDEARREIALPRGGWSHF